MRGAGFILGLELMRDGAARVPFDPALRVGARLDAAATRHGLILRVIGDRVVFAPPLVIEEEEIADIGVRLGRALDDVARELKAEAAQIPEECRLADYHAYWHTRKGYSGVSLHVRRELDAVEPVFSHPPFDFESRIVQADLGDLDPCSPGQGHHGRLDSCLSGDRWSLV